MKRAAFRLTPAQFNALAARFDQPAIVAPRARERARAGRGGHAALVAATVELLNVLPEVAWAHKFNTGQMPSPDGERMIRFAFKGCADILGQLRTGHFLAVECKTPKDEPTDDQIAFLQRVDRAGGCALWVRDASTAGKIVRLWAQKELRDRMQPAGRVWMSQGPGNRPVEVLYVPGRPPADGS